MKSCTKCGELKPLSQFSKRTRSKDGYDPWCKSCKSLASARYRGENQDRLREYYREFYAANREARLNLQKEYYKRNREVILKKSAERYPAIRDARIEYWRGYNAARAPEHRVYCRLYHAINRDTILARHRAYDKTPVGRAVAARKRHVRRQRAQHSPATLTHAQWQKILEIQKHRCATCGRKFTSRNPATRDHIIPLSKGGGLTFENVQALCCTCNSKKGDRIDYNLIASWINSASSPQGARS